MNNCRAYFAVQITNVQSIGWNVIYALKPPMYAYTLYFMLVHQKQLDKSIPNASKYTRK